MLPQEGGDIVRFHGVNGGADQGVIDRLQVLAAAADESGPELDLIQTPMIGQSELADDRTETFSSLGRLMGTLEISEGDEDVAAQGVGDLLPLQTTVQAPMPVELSLQSEGTPRGNADVEKSRFLIDEIKILKQALAAVLSWQG